MKSSLAALAALTAAIVQARSPADCAPCHRAQTEAFARSGMAMALHADPALPELSTKIGPYSYRVTGDGYTVTDGRDSIRVPIEWAFGQGAAGQTFLFRRDGQWYESRVSYFAALRGLDLTMGAQNIVPHNLGEAAGRAIPATELRQCFDCHSTSTTTPGVQCERCHGATDAHLRAKAPMRSLGALSTEEMSDFCGQCHRTWSQVAANGPHGIQNVRFQPYRLANSKCYDAADRRIRCTACHDPHREVVTAPAAYDAKCAACHSAKRVCRVATRDCVTCHMPKLDLPGAHQKFTDHRIRIARAGEPYPD